MYITDMEKIKIGISACLLGENVRYDGSHKSDHYLSDTMGRYVEWVPVCPEVEYGLSVPREAMHLSGDPDHPRLVTRSTGIDHTDGMLAWAANRLKSMEDEDLCGFVFKSKSPSSGMRGVKIYKATGRPAKKGVGIFAKAFMDRFPHIPVEDDEHLHDPTLRENFIQRVSVFMRWKNTLKTGRSVRTLTEFHTDHKLLIMSHSIPHYRRLGKLAAGAGRYRPRELFEKYIDILMQGLKLRATAKKNVNVLQHITGYFKQMLTADEKKELREIIGQYHNQHMPLIAPVTLLNHYVRKYDEPYLKRQYYLHPHPMELMPGNHA